MKTVTVTNQVSKAAGTITIPAEATVRPSGDKWKATNAGGLSDFFADLAEAEKYCNGKPAQRAAWTGSVFGR